MLHVRLGTTGDMQTILGFIEEASRWLPEKGTDQWSNPWPDRGGRDHRIRRGLESQRTWMVEDDGTPVGTISCRPDGNAELWTPEERLVPAIYVSRLIVRRRRAGEDIGRELLDWAGFWAAAQYGAELIRIDVWTTNAALQNYYEKRGFWRVRFAENVEYPSAALLQKSTAGLSAADIPRLQEIPRLLRPAGRREEHPLICPPGRRSAEPFAGLAEGDAAAAFTHLTRPMLFRGRASRRFGNWRRG
jgi:GNAT superfamily N-acetyltransferase